MKREAEAASTREASPLCRKGQCVWGGQRLRARGNTGFTLALKSGKAFLVEGTTAEQA